MNFHFSKRTFIRIISFFTATIVVLLSSSIISYKEAKNAAQTLEYNYLKSIDDLTNYVNSINNTLTKTAYAKSPAMLSFLSTKVWREAGFAKDCLSNLPIDYLNLSGTNKLLSQVGDYCVSISKKFERGETITDEEHQNISQLNEYCKKMLDDLIVLSDAVKCGNISLKKVTGNVNHDFDKQAPTQDISEGFKEDSEGFTTYPKLIYDGPFSDHLLEKTPLMLKNAKEVDQSTAIEKASTATSIPKETLQTGNDEDGKMPSYRFVTEGVDVCVTKRGGLLSYMLKQREVIDAKLSPEEALTKAEEYMKSLGIEQVKSTYYEIANNIITINYAATQGEAVLYTDLIKVGVAMDNGEIVSFDSRGYITNHYTRENITPKLTIKQAKEYINSSLIIESTSLCIIPSDSLEEKLCYEFKCTAQDKNNVIVYVNAQSGAEEQILILLISENGTLSM
ncbi:MAG: germination protein YpeB [Oscillospiraceae bacterium]